MGRMAEAGPATELSSQTGPLPKPDATNPSRTSGSLLGPCSTDLDRSRFLRIGAGQDVSESDGAEVHTRRTWAGANPETELPSQTGPAHLELAPQRYRTQLIRYRRISHFSYLLLISCIPVVNDNVDYDIFYLSYDILRFHIYLKSYRNHS